MSLILDAILAQAANGSGATAMLSSESVAVLLMASALLEKRANWLDKAEDPMDEITDEDWDEIERIVAGAYYEIMNPMIGMVLPVATQILPPNMLPLDNTIYDAADYPQLYAVIIDSLKLSGDRFILPALGGLSLVPAGVSPLTGTNYVREAVGGAETVTLNETQIPAHSHSIPLVTNGVAVAPGELAVVVPIPVLPNSTGVAGGGLSHNNMPPYIVMLYGVVAW